MQIVLRVRSAAGNGGSRQTLSGARARVSVARWKQWSLAGACQQWQAKRDGHPVGRKTFKTKLGLPSRPVQKPSPQGGGFCLTFHVTRYTIRVSMRKWIPVVIVFLLLLGGIWFWSLGALPDEGIVLARLDRATGDVKVQRSGNAEPVPAKINDEFTQGDMVITGADGEAVVEWFGQGESRLSTSTLIEITALGLDAEDVVRLNLRLEAGRIWTRFQSLLDLESSVSVETSDVVATVRGTSFDLEKHGSGQTTLWVSDSAVETEGPSVAATEDGLLVVEGSMARFGGAYRTTSTVPISASGTQSAWFVENKEADAAFDARSRERLRKVLGLDRPRNGVIGRLSEWSQSLRGPKAGTRLVLRRLAWIIEEAESGAQGRAAEDFAKLERDVREQIDRSKPQARDALRRALWLSRRLFENVDSKSPAYRYKQALEEWRMRLARNDAERMFVGLLAIADRLHEGRSALERGDRELAVQMVGIAEQSLGNVSREIEELAAAERVTKLVRARLRALRARAAALRAATNPEPISLPTTPSSTNMLIDTKVQLFINGKPL